MTSGNFRAPTVLCACRASVGCDREEDLGSLELPRLQEYLLYCLGPSQGAGECSKGLEVERCKLAPKFPTARPATTDQSCSQGDALIIWLKSVVTMIESDTYLLFVLPHHLRVFGFVTKEAIGLSSAVFGQRGLSSRKCFPTEIAFGGNTYESYPTYECPTK